MSLAIEDALSRPQACLCPPTENPHGLVSLWEMLQFSIADLVAILDHFKILENHLRGNPYLVLTGRPSLQPLFDSVLVMQQSAEALGMNSSAAQARRVLAFWNASVIANPAELLGHLDDLQLRVRDELQEQLFYCVEADKSQWIAPQQPLDPSNPRQIIRMRLKTADEVFGPRVIDRLPSIEPDLAEAIRCYVFGCGSACVFHLMRATEIAVPKIAKLCGINDVKPSWGAVLDQAEKYTQRTKYEDLPPSIRPHIELLRTLVADMRSIQRAWRNKVVHIQDRIIPGAPEFLPETALDILSATRAFLRDMAESLPE